MKNAGDNQFLRFLLIFLHLILGLNGLAGGLLLMLKPDGSLLQMNVDWLQYSPFPNFLLPGVLLFTFLGVLPLLTLFGLITNKNVHLLNFLNLYADRNWAWCFSLYTGTIAILWINVQLVMTQYFWLQPVISLTGLAILVLTLVPRVMNYYHLKTNSLNLTDLS